MVTILFVVVLGAGFTTHNTNNVHRVQDELLQILFGRSVSFMTLSGSASPTETLQTIKCCFSFLNFRIFNFNSLIEAKDHTKMIKAEDGVCAGLRVHVCVS